MSQLQLGKAVLELYRMLNCFNYWSQNVKVICLCWQGLQWSLTGNSEMSLYRKQTQERTDSSSYPKRIWIRSSEGLEGIAKQGSTSVINSLSVLRKKQKLLCHLENSRAGVPDRESETKKCSVSHLEGTEAEWWLIQQWQSPAASISSAPQAICSSWATCCKRAARTMAIVKQPEKNLVAQDRGQIGQSKRALKNSLQLVSSVW